MLSLRSTLVRSAIAALILSLSAREEAAAQQNLLCGTGGASVTFHPSICQGDVLSVTFANHGPQMLLINLCSLGVASGACAGPPVGGLVNCPGVDIILPPMTLIELTWNQSTSLLQPGVTYFANIVYDDGTGTPQSCCILISAVAGVAPYGPSKAGSGGVAPELLAVNGAPHAGNTQFTLRVQLALGAANALLVFGTQSASIQGPFGTLLVDVAQPHIMVPVSLGGPPNGIGSGSLDLNVPIPNNPALIGFTGFVQAFVADFGAPFHWSHTNGLSVTACP